MGNGNTLVGADKMKSPSFRIHQDKLEAFDAAIEASDEWDSRSEAIRSFVEETIGQVDLGDEFLPSDTRDRQVYLAMLGAANEKLIYSPRRHGNALRRQLGEGDLEAAAFVDLRRKGFIARQSAPPGQKNGAENHVYRVKPRCADPEQWKYREVQVA